MNYILYCAISSEMIIYQIIYSIVSIQRVTNCTRVTFVVVTDQAEVFHKEIKEKNLQIQNVIVEGIAHTMASEWIGDDKYIYRVKIKAIEYFFQKYKHNVLFLDGDTAAFRDILPLFESMRENEFTMFRTDKKIIENIELKQDYFHLKDKKYNISADYYYYNSGVIGIHRSFKNKIKEVLELSDVIYKQTGTIVAEEIAFSCIMQDNGNIRSAVPYFIHYVFWKESAYLIGSILGFFLHDHEKMFAEFINPIKIDEKIMQNSWMNEQNLRFIIPIFMFLKYGGKLDINLLTSVTIEHGFIEDNQTDKEELKQFLDIFLSEYMKPKKDKSDDEYIYIM